MKSRTVALMLALGFLPGTAVAEVSDKAASIPQHWLIAVPIAVCVFLVARFRWWLGLLVAVVPVFLLWGTVEMISDPHLGTGLWHEQGLVYFVSLGTSDLLTIGALVAGICQGRRRRRRKPDETLPNKPLQTDGAAARASE